jgi:hypothetical protein
MRDFDRYVAGIAAASAIVSPVCIRLDPAANAEEALTPAVFKKSLRSTSGATNSPSVNACRQMSSSIFRVTDPWPGCFPT